MIAAQQIVDVLGVADALGNPVHDMMELDELVAEGLPRSTFDALIDRLAAGADEITRVSPRSAPGNAVRPGVLSRRR